MSHPGPEIGREGPRAAPSRHDLLRVDRADWASVAATLRQGAALSPAGAALVEGWGEARRPVIARRRVPGDGPGDGPGSVPVGLPLPPSAGKARVALAIPARVGWQPVPPVLLAQATAAAPAHWRDTLDDLLRLAEVVGATPRVFGALLWEVATGLAYLRPGSDLDLLWLVEDPSALVTLLEGLERIAARALMRIDGEILTTSGGVQWRELADARRDPNGIVLVKTLHRAGFVPAASLLSREVIPCR